ncbi:transglutaminase domain-containing protein [Flavobacterium sp.]|uniref:transglutaminase domain-containing protein n=1 Tax=Flavobacterium sp. TaxID=239 RepID=UPI00286BC4CB|nr:transglutaminase domain-containing protein [Flavobacterium sp.]
MKKNIQNLITACCLLITFITGTSYSQSYTAVDNAIANYPKSFASPEKLAEKIKTDFASEEEKARAIFTWMALNIHYDLKAFESLSSKPKMAYTFSSEEERINKEQKFRRDGAATLLRTKKGVCQDYTALFHTLCELCGLKCMTIVGTSKTALPHIGKLPTTSDHAWNAVKVGETWRFIDVTWGSGMMNLETGKMMQQFNDAYFFTPPGIFFLNHFPDDKRYLMTDKTAEDFAALPLYYGRYLKSGYEFLTPEKGIFSIKETENIPLSIADLPEKDQVAYVFSNDNKPNLVTLKREGNVSTFNIPVTRRNRGYLTIYVNNESVVAYKIIP